eukprot:TRINITY_DN2422_c0_g1_i6.p1 TRINITY_DN2422_c0_g1~~TRINITY_DN2422_c0_g1_i6.p1  ORF type:complete len:319 (+),score=56.39 TRINITY_DN2422_c0_g1_i6:178-1134(+)
MNPPPTYWDYLKLEDLLSLQQGMQPIDGEPVSVDELHFITVHQTFELWFKLILAELRMCRDKLAEEYVKEESVPYVVHHINRVIEILRTTTGSWTVMKTLLPQDFLEFRTKLGSASGFQSIQMREIESVLGLQEEQRQSHGHQDPLKILHISTANCPSGNFIRERLKNLQSETTFRSTLHNWLYRTPILGSFPEDEKDSHKIDSFVEEYLENYVHSNKQHVELLKLHQGEEIANSVRQRYEVALLKTKQFIQAEDIPEGPGRIRMRRVRVAVLFIESYREFPLLAWPRLLLDKVAELEEQLVLFRFFLIFSFSSPFLS